jgi:hypothetical protein
MYSPLLCQQESMVTKEDPLAHQWCHAQQEGWPAAGERVRQREPGHGPGGGRAVCSDGAVCTPRTAAAVPDAPAPLRGDVRCSHSLRCQHATCWESVS